MDCRKASEYKFVSLICNTTEWADRTTSVVEYLIERSDDSTNNIRWRRRKVLKWVEEECVVGWTKSNLRRRFQSDESLDPVFVGVLQKSVPNDFIKTQANPSILIQKHSLCWRLSADVFHSRCYDIYGFCHCTTHTNRHRIKLWMKQRSVDLQRGEKAYKQVHRTHLCQQGRC